MNRTPKSLVTQYRRDLTRSAHAVAALESTRRQLIEAGCPHPEEFRREWIKSIYQVGNIFIGSHCMICDSYVSDFDPDNEDGVLHWKTLEGAAFANEHNCPHKPAWSVEYRWHHGYGKYVNGESCGNCGSWRGFKGVGLWNSKDTPRYVRDDD